ncbi:ribonuclease H-like domain-containing protein [Tanacetum coccineum]
MSVLPTVALPVINVECVKDLKEQNEQLVKDLRTTRISVVSYKTGLESVEARLLVFKKNESVYEEDIKLLKREIYLRDLDIKELKRKLDLATKEKDEVQLTIQKFENSSKNLSKLLDSQIMDKCKTGLGYNAVPPPYTRNFMPPKSDLVYPSLDDFVDVNESVSKPVVEKPTVETNEPKTARKENGAPIIEDWVSESEEDDEPKFQTAKPNFTKIEFVKPKTDRKPVKQIRQDTYSPSFSPSRSPRGNKRNWNQKMSQKLGNDFEMFKKACHVCGSFDHLKNDCNNWYSDRSFAKPVWINVQRVNKQNFSKLTHPSPKRNMVPRTVLTRRPFNKITAVNNSNFTKKVNTVKGTRVNTARPKAVLSAAKGNKGNAVKASAYYEEIDGGFVTFGGNSKGGKITRKDFKLTDESHVLLKVPRKDNMYNVDLKNVVPQGGLTCLFAKATPDEFNLWHRRLGHVNFKTMNKLVKGNLVRGLPSKLFEINQTCVACQKGKQHRASCIENLIDLRVKVIRCDNGTEFKNKVMNQFCEMKDIKRGFSVARTPQQNRVAERKNRTLIEAARTMLADSKLPTTFWAEAVNTACYVQNRVLVIKPHNKTPYELFVGRKLALSFMRPFGRPVTILNTIDHLGKFDGKADEGFFVGYFTNSKAFRVFNSRTMIVEENLHVKFSEDTPNIVGSGPNWLFDIDALTNSMNYKPVVAGNQSNGNAGTKACDDASKTRMETVPGKDYILLPLWTQDLPFYSSSKDSPDVGFKPSGEEEKKDAKEPKNEDSKVTSTIEPKVNQEKDANVNNTNNIKTVSPTVNVVGIVDNDVAENIVYGCADDPNMPEFEEIGRFSNAEDDISGADMKNLDTYFQVSPVPTTRIHKGHPIEQMIRDLNSAPQTRRMTRNLEEHGFLSTTLNSLLY